MLLRESAVELAPGSVLDRRFQIRRVLGKGATGVVLEADDRVSRSLVALKVFKPEIASDDRWQEILGSELRHARQIMHPNVCRVFDVGEADGYRFLSMEYASGGSLRQRLKEAAADRPFEERVADARAVVDGLAAIHAAGLIHRDVKPDNVLRMEDGRLVLTDFGLAVAPGQSTFVSGYSGAVGTPAYMAPEVAMGGDASMASDVFSLGVILHEIFFGRRPEWDTTKRGRFLRAPVDRRSPRRLRQMARLCAECLEQLSPRRPQTALEVKRQFERAVLGRYGTFLGALRAGKWGIVAGLLLAVLGTSAALLLNRRTDGVVRPRIVGQAADWSRQAKIMARHPGPLRCLTASRDGRTARVIWGLPPEPIEIDTRSGGSRPWKLLPETYAGGRCPTLSPDERHLAFTMGDSTPQVMLAPNPDGRGARALTAGFNPQWHPSGQELVYLFDMRRVGVVGMHGLSALLPETMEPDDFLTSVAISHAGDRLATLHTRQETSKIVIHEFPSLKPIRKLRLDTNLRVVKFASPEDQLLIIGLDEGAWQVFELQKSADTMVRHGRIGAFDISLLAGSVAGLWFSTQRRWATLFAALPNGRKQELARSKDFLEMSAAEGGDVLMAERLTGGGSLIGFFEKNSSRYRRLTRGPSDVQPMFQPGGKAFVYVDQREGTIRLCRLGEPLACREVVSDRMPIFLAGFSPSGEHLAFQSYWASRARLRIVSIKDGTVTDLGPGSIKRCKVRWSDENRLWSFRASESEWAELDLASPGLTGRTEPIGRQGPDGCPEVAAPSHDSVTAVSEREAVIWFRQN
jgi:serine/threonine protein kinase